MKSIKKLLCIALMTMMVILAAEPALAATKQSLKITASAPTVAVGKTVKVSTTGAKGTVSSANNVFMIVLLHTTLTEAVL